jgi:hypothetical protein
MEIEITSPGLELVFLHIHTEFSSRMHSSKPTLEWHPDRVPKLSSATNRAKRLDGHAALFLWWWIRKDLPTASRFLGDYDAAGTSQSTAGGSEGAVMTGGLALLTGLLLAADHPLFLLRSRSRILHGNATFLSMTEGSTRIFTADGVRENRDWEQTQRWFEPVPQQGEHNVTALSRARDPGGSTTSSHPARTRLALPSKLLFHDGNQGGTVATGSSWEPLAASWRKTEKGEDRTREARDRCGRSDLNHPTEAQACMFRLDRL